LSRAAFQYKEPGYSEKCTRCSLPRTFTAIELLLQLAKIHLAIPDARAALRYARKALDRSEHQDCSYAWGEANALHFCGICHKELKEPGLARKRLDAALIVRKRIQHPGAAETEKILRSSIF
jgi:hypothetical protein